MTIRFPMKIVLSEDELLRAAMVGARRNISSLTKGHTHAAGLKSTDYKDWQHNIEGACGELVLSKALNIEWNGSVDTFKKFADVGGSFEVRTTSSRENCLIIRPRDHKDRKYWHISGCAPAYVVEGWIKGEDGMQTKWYKAPSDRPSAFFVPSYALKRTYDTDDHRTDLQGDA